MIKLKYKKAAMFGLDARISLAIFGALSVIVGASLFKAITHTKATAVLTLMEEASKAIEAYYLDTGEILSKVNTLEMSAKELLDSSKPGWKGPYIDGFKVSASHIYNIKDVFSLHVFFLDKSSSFGDDVYYSAGICNAGTNPEDCYVWIYINKQENEFTAKQIDAILDGNDGPQAGKFRWYYSDATSHLKYRYFLNTGINYKNF